MLRLILGDQLSHSISSLENADKKSDVILICEVWEEATYTRHHPKKIAFLFSAMRHFAEELKKNGFNVRYITLDDPKNTGSFDAEVIRAIADTKCTELTITEPGEWRVLEKIKSWQKTLKVPVHIKTDTRFLCSIDEFKKWAGDKKSLRMEFFYRDMRKKHGILLDVGGKPVGGKWNFDSENRKAGNDTLVSPQRISHPKDAITTAVLKLVKKRFSDHFGDLEPFHFAVTKRQALAEAKHFIDTLLPNFGDYQDAMVAGEAYLYHSLLSSYINAGLLLPLEICRMAEEAYYQNQAPLNAVEGFIRQILGWREYVRGIYWTRMPDYAEMNYFNAARPLPEFYWGADTKMKCISEAVDHTKKHAYSHHIQRLMVTGNFALLAGIDPKEVCDWYLAVYSDAYEWVELPNTLGMALFGDGGIMASKPYAASGKYINKMGNFCKNCFYDPNITVGEKACPLNALYWDFMARHEDKLRKNQRLVYSYATWSRMDPDKKRDILHHARHIFKKLDQNSL